MSDKTTDAVRTAYFEGVREGLRKYAWWKEGVEYVGSCGTTLKAALAHVDAEEREAGKLDT